MRDYRKLQAFQLSNQLALAVYAATRDFPKDELFGLTSQMRRAAVSIGSNIAEGAARSTEKDYLRFLDIALGSSLELEYQITLSAQLGFLNSDTQEQNLRELSTRTSKALHGLIQSYRAKH
ncbi:four helix bundle protein [bacterium]|nr:four helix bundle protein [bacterium]